MSQVLRTEATGEKQGFMKAVVSASDDRILGFTMIGSEAGEVLAAVQTAMMAQLPDPKLRDAVFSHLTMAEGFGPLFRKHPSPISLISKIRNRTASSFVSDLVAAAASGPLRRIVLAD